MRQRLALATALVCDPEILILDEPANGLDPEGVHWLRILLRRLADEGRTVLVSSHILAEVAQTVDSVVILDRGRLVTESTLADLTAGGGHVVRVRTPRAADLAAAAHRPRAPTRPSSPPTEWRSPAPPASRSAPWPPSTPYRSSRPPPKPPTSRTSSSASPQAPSEPR